MPYNRFICPDQQECQIKDCLENGCRIPWAFEAERCLSLPTLRAIAEQREWDGFPSTTMLLNGTRESYLRITTQYAVKPEDMIWALFGTGVHYALEQFSDKDDITEERIYGKYSSGSPDRFEKSTGFLYDYKTYGSYKTAKVLGIQKIKVPVMNEDGTPKIYKSGQKKGQQVFTNKIINGHKSRLDLAIQLNDYRMKIEQQRGYKVKKMFGEILTRDGGTFVAEGRGVDRKAQLVQIHKISDHWIETYMKAKHDALMHAIETNELPPPCKHRETWGGLKCREYCHVWQDCDVGRKEHGLI